MGKTGSSPSRTDHHESESWEQAARPPALARGEVHVWHVGLDAPAAQRPRLAALLAPDESRRAARFRFPQLGDRYTAARGTLRRLLGDYSGVDPATLRFVYGPRGKPALENGGDLHFNLAHAAGHALIAVTREVSVGVDLEEIAAAPDLDDVAETHFAPGERRQLDALADGERLAAFYRIWTRKEAYLKAVGDGLAVPLQHFTVSLERQHPRLVSIEGDASAALRWMLVHLEPAAGFVGALAVPAHVRLRRFAWTGQP